MLISSVGDAKRTMTRVAQAASNRFRMRISVEVKAASWNGIGKSHAADKQES